VILVVDPDTPTPPYEQVRAQVVDLVRRGELEPGTRLPTVRRLAGDLGLAPNTVARAYRELEVAGVVVKRGTTGTFVSESGSPLARRERVRILSERVDALLAEARQLGFDTDALFDLIRRRDRALQPRPEES
jgi:GntR family transcriptional regulator